MSDEIHQFLIDSDRGTLQASLPLKNKLDLPGGRRGTAHLCAVEGKLWIVACSDGLGRAHQLPLSEVSIIKNFWGTALRFHEQTYSLPTLSGHAEEVFAHALLFHADPIDIEDQLHGEWVCNLNAIQKLWFQSHLEESEELIAVLETGTSADFTPSIEGSSLSTYLFVLSDRRCGLLGLSSHGESKFFPLIRQTLHITRGFGRAVIHCGPQEWLATFSNADLFESNQSLAGWEKGS